MNSRERFLAACACKPLDRPPIWVMRQAGRYLPEYRAMKERHSFLEMVRTPELALEVTMQPLRRFPLDAAILFSDILVIPEAMGQPYRFKDEGGIAMEFRIDGAADIARLSSTGAGERLQYISDALHLIKAELAGSRALLGFAGAPWTLASYMVEGGGSETFARVKELFYSNRALFDDLMTKVTDAVIESLRLQIAAGADAVQLFDSWGSALPACDYEAGSLVWIRRIVAALPAGTPVILFAKGVGGNLPALASSGASVLGFDWTVDLPTVRSALPTSIAVQGNLDPVVMNLAPDVAAAAARRLLEAMHGLNGHIFNLGHGILPQARPESMAAVCDSVVSWPAG
ncbi:MAG TPA: uroporphyrinogen decarboxylase [Opitutaceae bacterium]|nr:uroporphyrinogen decarboxylase [Opitutaceae bacterium]